MMGAKTQQKAGGAMMRIDSICVHPLWKESIQKIQELEKTRKFCGHNTVHLLDVARIAYIENLECGFGISREEIYAAALLHDIGRHLQYEEGIPHDQASVGLAEEILQDCGFETEERKRILDAIAGHRCSYMAMHNDLAGLIYRADKRSRMCLFCEARQECDWSEEKKNLHVLV